VSAVCEAGEIVLTFPAEARLMRDEPNPGNRETSERGAPPAERAAHGMSPAQLHHHEDRFLKALKLIVNSGRARTIDDLIRYAEQDKQVEAVGYLRTLAADALPVDLAYDALCVHTRIVAHKRNNSLLTGCQGKRVGLVLPLPHHVMDAFTSLTDVTLLIPDTHHLPPHLRGEPFRCCHSTRESRQAVEQLDGLVFEAVVDKGTYYVDVGTSDVVDCRIVPAATQLIVHLRPHRNPNDVPLQHPNRTLNIL
jgi:hypothetical protein